VSHADLLIRGGYVLTMDPAGDIAGGDVHVRDGVITAVDVPEVTRATRAALSGVLSRAAA